MIDIRTGELADILPVEFIRQPQAVAISYALKKAYETFLAVQTMIYVYAFVDGAPGFVLDLLAVELRVRYYDSSLELKTKRKLIKSAILVNMKDGTTFAVDTVVATIYNWGRVLEWYEYGGENNHFRVELDANNGGYDVDALLSAIMVVKRMSSKLDSIELLQKQDQDIFHGTLLTEQFPVIVESPTYEIEYLVDENGDRLLDELDNVLLGEHGFVFS